MNHLANKYSKWYFSLVESRRNHTRMGILEKHHIIPRCLGGSDRKENIVSLTPREHFVAHMLLSKMFVGKEKMRMNFALHMMLADNSGNRYKPTSRSYEMAKKALSDAYSELNKGRIPWNKGIPREQTVKDAVSKANTGKVPWNKGKARSEEEKAKMREGWARRKLEGHIPHNKGKSTGPLSKEHANKISNANKGRTAWNKGITWQKKSKSSGQT